MKKFLRLSRPLFIGVLAVLILNSCENEITSSDVEEYVDEVVFRMEESGNMGKYGCYTFVFPISISFPDGTTADAEDYDGLKEAIRGWKEANPESSERPELGFPLEVMSEEGEVISVANREELHELRRSCRRDFFQRRGHKGHGKRCNPCFEIVFPLTIVFPDGATAEAADRMALKELAREWKSNNPDAEGRPEIQFPVTVEYEDGSTATANDKEELKALKEGCNTEG